MNDVEAARAELDKHDEFCESLTRIVSVCACATRQGKSRTLDALLEIAFAAGWASGSDVDNPMPRDACFKIWRRDLAG